jgi:predicted porin
MKKSLIALAALGAFVGAASAQSSVTLFGVVDVNARQVKNGGDSQKQMGTDGLASSRIGFRGVEDLGNGLKAGFWLESAVNPDSGTANSDRFWHRRATVSLMGSFGELRLGRQLDPSYTAWSSFDAFNDNGVGKSSLLFTTLHTTAVTATAPAYYPYNYDTQVRSDNLVNYVLPSSLGGVYGEFAVAPSEGTNGKKYTGGKLGFASGPVDVALGYATTETNIASGDKFKVGSLGASYDFQVVKVFALVAQQKLLNEKQVVSIIGVHVPVGAGKIRASVGKANSSGSYKTSATVTTAVDGDDSTQFGLGYVHDLSKRTQLYTTYSQIKNKNNANLKVASFGTTTAKGDKSSGLEFGIKHSF